MSDITVREIQGEEMLEIMHWLTGYGLNPSPPLPDKEERQEIFKKRRGATYYALFEDEEAAACAASARMIQQVRGKLYPMAGIWGVATHPAARRKGYQRQVLGELLGAIREMEQPLSCLYPFRGSFYERLGYIPFPVPRKAIFPPSVLQPIVKQDLGGEVEMTLIGDGFDIYRDYLKRHQANVHGMAIFEHGDRDRAQRNTSWLAMAKVDGEIVGVMLYDLKGEMPTKFKLRAMRFYYHTSQGKYLLLSWIAHHIDQADQVEIWLPPNAQPETWLSDLRVQMEPVFFPPMGRVLDVANIGGMVTGEGGFSARISDPICPWNEGVWRFETVDSKLTVSAGEVEDCKLDIRGLSALVYGTHDPGDFPILGWGEPGADEQGIMREMFARKVPYLHELF